MTIERKRLPNRRPRVLVTGCRAPAALELVRLLAADGCEVHAAESVRHHLCRVSRAVVRSHEVPGPAGDPERFVDELERIVSKERIDWLIPTCEEIFYVSAGMERLSRLCRVFASPLAGLRRLHSKREFIRRAERLGFAVPPTERLESPRDWERLSAQIDAAAAKGEPSPFAQGFVLKPEFSRFASKVRIVREGRAGDVRPDERDYPWVIQQFVSGRGLCTYSIARDGRIAAHAAYAAAYAVRGGASVYFEPVFHERLFEWVRRFIKLECFTGQIAFDFIETEGGELYPLECNPRTTSGIHLFRPEDGLASVLVGDAPAGDPVVQPQAASRTMLALPMLAYGLRGNGSWRGFGTWLSKFVSARDAVFRWSDPRPFWEQASLLLELRRLAASRGHSLLEAATGDIEWNGGRL